MFLSKYLKLAVLRSSLLFVGLSVPAVVLAQAPATHSVQAASDTAAEQLVSILQAYKSLEGRFTQTLNSKAGKQLQTTEGTFKIKRPGLYLWQSAEPYPQTIVGNGQTIWVYDPDLEQVTVTPQAQMPFNPAVLLSGGIQDLSTRFRVEQVAASAQKASQSTFHLTPLNRADAPFAAVRLIFNKNDIAQAVLTDRLGQQTIMDFDNLVANRVLDDALFTFVPPKGTDVLMNE